jgi:hypothetical protein
MGEKPCKGLTDLNKANDYHLTLSLALLKALVENDVLSQKEVNRFVREAAKEVASLKLTLMAKAEEKSSVGEFVKAVNFAKA